MAHTTLSSKGQVIIPQPFRNAHNWKPGQQLEVIDSGEGILLTPVKPFEPTTLDEVAACLPFQGKAKSLAEMEDAIRRGALETANDRH